MERPLLQCSFCEENDAIAGSPWTTGFEAIDGELIWRVKGCKRHRDLAETVMAKASVPAELHAPVAKSYVRTPLSLLSDQHCPECGHPDCNGQCYGDDMMGDS